MNVMRITRNLLAGAALATGLLLAAPTPQAHAAVIITAGFAPPPIPVYEQPECPGDGYLWTPGYWAWGDGGYYWVDGAWVLPPYVGGLWTPGYWGWGGGGYFWHPGYWGLRVGYYGGINYGFGYFGVGFYGGYWNGGRFFYNRAYGHFGEGFRGGFYNRSYAGFNSRPGGASFARNDAAFRGNAGNVGRASSLNAAHSFQGGGYSSAHVAPGGNTGGRGNFGGAPAASHSAPSYGGGGHAAPSYSGGGGHAAPAAHGGGGGHAGGGRR